MELLNFKHQLGLICVMLLLPVLCTSQDTFTCSRATYYGSPDCYGNPRGACGFGEYGKIVNDGNVAGVSWLWKNGSGCGACYQVRCKIPQFCDDYGAYVVVTDFGVGDRTDFVMSPRGYSRLGKNADASAELFKYGVVDVEYKRVPCRYNGYNILLKVHERSNNPHYLAILIIYIGGTNDITAVDLWQEDCKDWRPMRRAFGAVFDAENPPRGDIKLRFQVRGSAGLNWVESKNVISSDWNAGAVYDSEIQLD
ncbi:expansin-like B1 [Lotus japonicus]|uniref:expansin-like B1 n=1 Tax=Lotus japonicus TaxID=34305 RepID=UPI0025891134|nr:expansin-like B1 [Lotus japonicus]